jgi:hypothetical protein
MGMFVDFKVFAFKLGLLVLAGPFIGYLMLKFADSIEDAWKTNSRKKKWVVMCTLFGMISGLAGWLQ